MRLLAGLLVAFCTAPHLVPALIYEAWELGMLGTCAPRRDGHGVRVVRAGRWSFTKLTQLAEVMCASRPYAPASCALFAAPWSPSPYGGGQVIK